MTMPPKIIFLDVDGPMVPARVLMLRGNTFGRWCWTFDPAAVSMLNFLYWADDSIRLVLSSHRWGDAISQRCHGVTSPYEEFPSLEAREFWDWHLKLQGLKVPFHEDWLTVRTMASRNRYIKRAKWEEIHDWLKLHPEINYFVTLEDDLNGGDEVSPSLRRDFHLVAEDYDQGVTWSDFKKMCNHLRVALSKDKYFEYSEQLHEKA